MAQAAAPLGSSSAPLPRSGLGRALWSWITTVDHKRIGILYGATALIFFVIGGIEALIIRIQLASPEASVVNADQYNRIFTMHGTTMVFLVVMPLGVAFFNYLVPLMIGARDVAFPRLNAFSYWVFLFGGLFLYLSFFTGGNILRGEIGAPDGGWTGYTPLTLEQFTPGNGINYWALGLIITGFASIAGALNFLVTILNMRAPGMSLLRMPVFVWMALVTSFLTLGALTIIAAGLFELAFDRLYDTNFHNPAAGASPLLWQHMFWLFGHPEVYILILPAFGIISEVIPVFSRKPLFGYPFIVFSGIAIGLMSWGVWVHHMYTTGLGTIANTAFAVATILIAAPTGVKIFSWLGTMWGGSIRFTTSMLFALGFVAMFTIGGLTGVTHSMVPSDYQQHDTYYVVAHLHQVFFGGAIFALFSGFYYWFPKVTGKMLGERLGQANFWLMFIGFNLTFQPFMILGLMGMPRRVSSYPSGFGWDFWNMMSTIGAFALAFSVLLFFINVFRSISKGQEAGADPWDARTLEWSIPSPPPEYNFAEIPRVRSIDDWWRRKYVEDAQGVPVPVPAGGAIDRAEHGEPEHEIHLPSPSFFPIIAAGGLPLIALGMLYTPVLIVMGVVLLVVGVYGWVYEPPEGD